jgi:hypothetical protein
MPGFVNIILCCCVSDLFACLWLGRTDLFRHLFVHCTTILFHVELNQNGVCLLFGETPVSHITCSELFSFLNGVELAVSRVDGNPNRSTCMSSSRW